MSTKEAEKKLEESDTEPEKAGNEEASQISDGPKAAADNLEDEKKGEDEGGVNGKSLPEESSESLFSLSIGSRKQFTATEKAEYEVNSPMPLRGAFCNTKEEFDSEVFGSSQSTRDGVQIVSRGFNPVENFAQGKSIKVSKTKQSTDVPSNSNSKRKVNFDLNVNTNEELSSKALVKRSNQNREDQEKPQINECPKSVASGKSSNFSHYRYRDCSDEEYGDFYLNESDFGDKFVNDEERSESEEKGKEVNVTLAQEESSESLFSLSTCSRKQVSAAENAENEVNSPIPTRGTESFLSSESRIQNVPSVPSPIQNFTQGKLVEATALQPLLKCEKENMNMNSEQDIDVTMSAEPNLKVSNGKARQKKFNDKRQEEIRVDTSLSSWLVETETTPISKSGINSAGDSTPISKRSLASPVSHEDRPILGALTIEELRKFSASTPSRRSKVSTPDDTPIIGTVGSYWSHTKQEVNSDLSSRCGQKSKAGSKSREVLSTFYLVLNQ